MRYFKTDWFSKAAKNAGISDQDLCAAIRQVVQGQAYNLGGGVFKKRLNSNQHRSIILAKGGQHWIYTYLFAKNDRDNIDKNELATFRKLANSYASMTTTQLDQQLHAKKLVEICNDCPQI